MNISTLILSALSEHNTRPAQYWQFYLYINVNKTYSTLEPKRVMDVAIAMLLHQMPKELSEELFSYLKSATF